MRLEQFSKKAIKKMKRAALRQEEEIMGKMFKPRPRWIPRGVYVWMLGFFIKIDKE